MKFSLPVLLALTCSLTAFSQTPTPIGGGVYNDITLTAASSPYLMTSDMVVFNDATFTLEEGVEILVDSNRKLEVRGRLVVKGTEDNRVVIRGNTTTNNKIFWRGIVFIATEVGTNKAQADFQYCDISNARECLNFDIAYQGPYTFRNCNFTYNKKVNTDGGAGGMLFDGCLVQNNDVGFEHFQFGGTISNCVIDGNTIGVDGSDKLINCKLTNNDIALRPYGITTNCEIVNNKVGVEAMFNSVNNTFVGNKVKNNTTGVSIQTYFNGYINFTENEICDNTEYNIVLQSANPCNLANNCWCTTDSVAIRSKIYDGYTDITRGLVNITPFKTSCSTTSIPNPGPAKPGQASVVLFYPNPIAAGSVMQIETSSSIRHFNMADMMGRVVNVSLASQGYNHYTIDLQGIVQGVYFVNLQMENGEQVLKRISVE